MKSTNLFMIAGFLIVSIPVMLAAEVNVGDKAPDFSAMDSHGNTQTLSKYAGKIVTINNHFHYKKMMKPDK